MTAMQLARRAERGGRQIGWKVGFGAPAAMEMLKIDRPLVGFLTEAGCSPYGADVPVGAWTKPMLEAEVAVHLGARRARPTPRGTRSRAAIGGLSAAIELADLDPPPDGRRAILAGNIFHRHVLLGPVDRDRSTGDGIGARVVVDGEEVAATDDPPRSPASSSRSSA